MLRTKTILQYESSLVCNIAVKSESYSIVNLEQIHILLSLERHTLDNITSLYAKALSCRYIRYSNLHYAIFIMS